MSKPPRQTQVAKREKTPPSEKRSGGVLLAQQERTEMLHVGPLPHPELLRQYEDLLPGAAERIITMAEHQAEHRQHLERTVIQGDVAASRRGTYAGLVISLAFLVGAVILGIAGQPVQGTIMGTTDIVALAGVFVYGSRSRSAERGAKQRKNP